MFCPKCGNEIPNQAVFCPKCGESINGSGGQSQPSPTPPETTASPVQKTAGKVHICLLLISLILSGLWFANTIVMCDDIDYSVLFALSSHFAGPANEATIIMCVLFCLNLIGSVIFFARHMPKQDRKVSIPILSWFYWIWNIGFYVCMLCIGKWLTKTDPQYESMTFAPSVLGWLYIVFCVILFGLLVYLTVLHFKAKKERKAWQKDQ